MEAFETFVALALEEGFIVSPAVKFPVRRRVRKAFRAEFQEHGYEVDLIATRADQLVLATVKSFLGSRGPIKVIGLDEVVNWLPEIEPIHLKPKGNETR